MNDLLFPADAIPIKPLAHWLWGDLQPHAYSMIMIDPPWRFVVRSDKGVTPKGAGGQYRLMPIEQIKELPVWALADRDAILWMWATAPLLPQALEVMRAWRFEYVTMGTWAKRTKTGKLRWGTGYRLRSTSEPFLIGVRGSPKNARNVPSHIDGLAREHSRKPEEAYAAAEKLMPDARRADVFARQRRPNWESFGRRSWEIRRGGSMIEFTVQYWPKHKPILDGWEECKGAFEGTHHGFYAIMIRKVS